MENIHKQMEGFGDQVILVYHHSNDDFAIEHSRTLSDFYRVEGFPSSMIDRTKGVVGKEVTFHPGYLTKAILEKKLAEPTYVTINLTTSYNQATKEIKVKVEGELFIDYPKAKLNVYLVQDGIVHKQVSGGDNYVHRNALRAVLSQDTWGDALDISQGAYSKGYSYTLREKIGKFPTDPNKMYIVAFVENIVNTSDDNTQNIVLNAAIKRIK